jgi:hypothetical protein
MVEASDHGYVLRQTYACHIGFADNKIFFLHLTAFCVLNAATELVSVIIVARYGDAVTVF